VGLLLSYAFQQIRANIWGCFAFRSSYDSPKF
jgi:hypothetical protein